MRDDLNSKPHEGGHLAIRGPEKGSGRGLRDLRQHNRRVVLGLLKQDGITSRSTLARRAGLSLPSLIDIVQELVGEGVIEELGSGPSNGGRPPMLLRLRPSSMAAIGFSVGIEAVAGVVTDLNAQVMAENQRSSMLLAGKEGLRKQLVEMEEELLARALTLSDRVLGIGLAVPAAVLESQGHAFAVRTNRGVQRIQPHELVIPSLRKSIAVDNYANALAVGEHMYGSAQGARHVLCVVLQHAPGSALILNGELYRGRDGAAGEVAHMLIDPSGPSCACGRRGCLTAFVGHRRILRQAMAKAAVVGARKVGDTEVGALSATGVIQAACDNDAIAGEVMLEVGRYLGVAIANLSLVVNPDLVVLGGPSVRAPQVLPAIEYVLRERLSDPPPVRLGTLGDDAPAVGAAAMVLSQLFSPLSSPELGQSRERRPRAEPTPISGRTSRAPAEAPADEAQGA